MAYSTTKLDEALKELIEAFSELETELESKHGDDEDAFSSAMVDTLETAIDSAIEEQDYSTSNFATMLSCLSESLEQLDPSAFEGDEEEEFSMDDDDIGDVDYDLLDDDLDEDVEEEEEDD